MKEAIFKTKHEFYCLLCKSPLYNTVSETSFTMIDSDGIDSDETTWDTEKQGIRCINCDTDWDRYIVFDGEKYIITDPKEYYENMRKKLKYDNPNIYNHNPFSKDGTTPR